MNLNERLPTDRRTFDGARMTTVLWLAGLGFAGTCITLFLLHRLGLPMVYSMGITFTFLLATTLVLSWITRTMTSSRFFFAGHQATAPVLGLGGQSDWACGAFLILFFSVSLTEKVILAPALMLGILLQAVLIASAFQRSRVLTLPGFFAWRGQTQMPGHITLLVSVAILLAISLAEFEIAHSILSALSGLKIDHAAIVVILVAILPSIFGGWHALLLINAAFVTILIICLMGPAILVGFLPDLLQTARGLEGVETGLANLNLAPFSIFSTSDELHSAGLIILTMFVFAAGFAALPHSISRLSLNNRPISSVESLGWTALIIFLSFSALPLSIGLIINPPSSVSLAELLQTHPVFAMLPYFAVLLAAINGLAVTVFSASAAIVRALRRFRNLNPGEQSIFSTRLVIVLIALAILFSPAENRPSASTLFIAALLISAAGLFIPLVTNIWIAQIPQWSIALAVIGGTACVALGLFGRTTVPQFELVTWSAMGMGVAMAILLIGRLTNRRTALHQSDARLNEIRNPQWNR